MEARPVGVIDLPDLTSSTLPAELSPLHSTDRETSRCASRNQAFWMLTRLRAKWRRPRNVRRPSVTRSLGSCELGGPTVSEAAAVQLIKRHARVPRLRLLAGLPCAYQLVGDAILP